MNIRIDLAMTNDEFEIIHNMMANEPGINDIFKYKLDRLMTSQFSFIIKYNDKDIGFINLVEEKKNQDFLFLDMGIIKEYRGKGIGKMVMEDIKEKVEESGIEEYIIGQTKVYNTGGNNCIKDIGSFLMTADDCNFYLLQKDRLEEFLDGNYQQKLSDHLGKSETKIMLKK